jgi:cytochrome P450
VIEEAMRMHQAVGLPLERIVPAPGLTLPDGRFLAPGTIVGMNAWVVHRDKTVFGQHAESFNPARWLQAPDEMVTEFRSRWSRMREASLTFGAGNRVCLGKNLSTLEIYKFIYPD